MLLPASRMQISFLKDLAVSIFVYYVLKFLLKLFKIFKTFRNPMSDFTFINYLHSHGIDRLAGFSNLGHWTPSRTEWAGYLTWAANKLSVRKLHCIIIR